MRTYDVIVIGGGQSALATAYYLRRSGLRYVLLDKAPAPGGSWQYYWDSLSLFSPAQYSSLPGVLMPGGMTYPSKEAVLAYLRDYEARYQFPVIRPVAVSAVQYAEGQFHLQTSGGDYHASAVVSATGSFSHPYTPVIADRALYRGEVIHASEYRHAAAFAGKRVAVVGEGNTGAQLLAELSEVAQTIWITLQAPSFLPDDIDGRYLFDVATQQYAAKQQGRDFTAPSLGRIVMVPAVKAARSRGVYAARPAFDAFWENGIAWKDGAREIVDAVIFCTGYRPALEHLAPLGLRDAKGRIATNGTRAVGQPGLWLVGYGEWTGFASATLIGVGRSARKTVEEITAFFSS
ncbi:ArsO family NAD(P)H-dependent flavin-containing monooxygenase [Chitinophaga vietnamensis]|uniref:ArsO family NAD(P)H-dependent flavin-containing monooxygenase n=1 Tax=Chitinophaga vietnamensis TaxID=2593957 RepID=UPI001177CDB2|nr:ArsO family NAD(P)H-dependent flavin-containing monooxygenase [Chitinophaga vietnamensis]